MKKLVSIALLLCLALGLVACGGSDSGSGDTLKIGVISPNTGSLAAYGTGIHTGAELAVEEINAAGGILGQQVELVELDDRADSTECLNAFNNLVSQGIGLIIGSATSGATSAITGPANEEGVVLISPTATNDNITTEDDYVFRVCYADSAQGAIAAAFVASQGIKKVGAVYCAGDPYSSGLKDSFVNACGEHGIEILASESSATLETQDYTNQFTAMVNAGVELVYAPYYYDVIGPYVIPQARAAGYDGIIMGADGYDNTQSTVSEGSDLSVFNDVYWTNHYFAGDTSEKVSSFVAAYKDKFGSEPSAFGATGYDCVYVYKAAIEAANSTDPAAVRDALADTSAVYECVSGTFSFDISGTPVKGAPVIAFKDNGDGTIGMELVDVVEASELA